MALRVAPNLTNTIASRFEYEIKVIYLGNEVLPTEPDQDGFDPKYRCKFDLEEADPHRDVEADEEILKKDKNKNWRVVIHDNHALHGADSNNLLGDGADNVSKPMNYNTRNWLRDIRPAVPFRVEVTKKENGTAVEIKNDELFIGWKVKDPEEELKIADTARNPARPKKFLQDFFKTYHRLTNDESSKEDDNCSDQFKGLRKRDGKLPVEKLLFDAPFNAGSPKPLPCAQDEVKSKVVPDSEDNKKGISDVFFFPLPIGGDNYTFEIQLLPKAGAPRVFKDSEGKEMDKYETIPFTVWRKIFMDLMVTFSSVDQTYINWEDTQKAYRAAFVEIVKPEGDDHVVTYDEAVWKQVVKDYFKNDVGNPNNATVDNDTYYDFNNHFLPRFPGNTLPAADQDTAGNPKQDWFWTHGEGLAKKFLARAYGEKNRKNPRTEDAVQDVNPGHFIFLCKHLYPGSGALGMYMGHREFFMVERGDTTCTFTHELGHAVYLRHAMVSFDTPNKVCTDISNDNWLDHDQKDSLVCTMAYQNDYYGADGKTKRPANQGPVEWHFCAVCVLKLRYWDTVELQKNSIVKGFILEGLKPIKVHDGAFAPIGGAVNMARNGRADFTALAEGEPTMNNNGGPFKKDLSTADGSRWVCDKPHLADFVTFGASNWAGRLQGKNAGAGSVKIHFEIHGIKSNEITVNIT